MSSRPEIGISVVLRCNANEMHNGLRCSTMSWSPGSNPRKKKRAVEIHLCSESKTGISHSLFPVYLITVTVFLGGSLYAQQPVVRTYLPNTAEEDWSFLSEYSSRSDFWDPLKYISLGGEGRYLTLSGEVRYRVEGFHLK